MCVKVRTAAGILGHLIGRNLWCETGSGMSLKSIKSVCSQRSGAVLDLALPRELGDWTWSPAWSGAWVKARQPRCNKNVIIVILFLVNLVWGLFFSLV